MVYISGGNELLDPKKIFSQLEIKAGDKIGDLGCGGAGHFSIPAAMLVGHDGMVYAVDIVKSDLKSLASIARLEGVQNIRTVWSNLEIFGATNIPANSLDVAFLINTLSQSKKREEIFKEAYRLLKKDGQLLMIDWKKSTANFGPPEANRTDFNQVKQIAKNLGLSLAAEFEAGIYHQALIFKK